MRQSHCEMLSDLQVAQIELRRKALGLTTSVLLQRFAAALKTSGCNQTISSAKMRLDRVINPRMRRPISDETKNALARALDWDFQEFDTKVVAARRHRQITDDDRSQLALPCDVSLSHARQTEPAERHTPPVTPTEIAKLKRQLRLLARTLESVALRLTQIPETHRTRQPRTNR